jgi:hypothetical protein
MDSADSGGRQYDNKYMYEHSERRFNSDLPKLLCLTL